MSTKFGFFSSLRTPRDGYEELRDAVNSFIGFVERGAFSTAMYVRDQERSTSGSLIPAMLERLRLSERASDRELLGRYFRAEALAYPREAPWWEKCAIISIKSMTRHWPEGWALLVNDPVLSLLLPRATAEYLTAPRWSWMMPAVALAN